MHQARPLSAPLSRSPERAPAVHPRRTARAARRQLALAAVYVVAGIAATWPSASYLGGRLPDRGDVSSYVWDLWWVAHQAVHLGNPWFTADMAAPARMPLGF